MIWKYVFIFIISWALLFFSGRWLVSSLSRIARFLGWREFVIAFFLMAFAGTLPNLFVGISAALHKTPQLSFGEIVGGNVIDLTLAVAIAIFFAKGGLPAESRTVQTTSIFTMGVAVLPILLIFDGVLGRGDGVILMAVFLVYIFWLFSKRERFTKIYKEENEFPLIKEFRAFLKDLGKVGLGVIGLLGGGEGIVRSATLFAEFLEIPPALVGIFIVGLGNAIPEIYFAVISAKRGQTWMILGDLMGAVITPATIVLGIVALIQPIKITVFPAFAIARLFLIFSALFFFLFPTILSTFLIRLSALISSLEPSSASFHSSYASCCTKASLSIITCIISLLCTGA